MKEKKVLEVYSLENGLTKGGDKKGKTQIAFTIEFQNRTALEQYQVLKSIVKTLAKVVEEMQNETVNEQVYFATEAEKSVQDLFKRLGIKNEG